jgi:uncharacterized protein YuzE
VHDWLVRITYDPVADAVFIYLVEIGPGEVERNAFFDREMEMGAVSAAFNRKGQLVGIEVLGQEDSCPKSPWTRLSASTSTKSGIDRGGGLCSPPLTYC